MDVQKDAAKDVWKGVAKVKPVEFESVKNEPKSRLPQNFLTWGMI